MNIYTNNGLTECFFLVFLYKTVFFLFLKEKFSLNSYEKIYSALFLKVFPIRLTYFFHNKALELNMGNKQLSQKDRVKQEYLKIIQSKKQEYYKKNEEILNSCDFKVMVI